MNKAKQIRAKIRLLIESFKNKKPIAFIRRLFKLNGYSYMPSSLTFYLVVSIVPLISLIMMILAQFNAPTGIIEDMLNELLPDSEFSENVIGYFQAIQPQDLLAIIFSSTISIYIASRGIECFSRFADHFYNRYVLDNHFIRRKARSIIMTLVFIVAISLIIILLVFFEKITSGFIPQGISKWLKYLAGFVLFFATIMALFYYSPTKKPKFTDVIPGAYLGSISIIVFIGMFFIYMSFSFDRYDSIYGPLSTIVILLLLIYFCCYILFMCFYLNILLRDSKDRKKMAAELKKLQATANDKADSESNK